MLSTVDLELTNFINPDLTWKVTKGYRNTTRRSRKPATRSLNIGGELDNNNPNRVQDSSFFESEKVGVAVLGRRFAEKVEHVPIKKRRFWFPSPPPRTPSPDHEESLSPQPQTPSPQPEESEQAVDGKSAPGQWCCPGSYPNRKIWAFDGSVAVKVDDGVGGVGDGKISLVTNGEVGNSDDFSGIALLAAAACSSSSDDDADNVKEASAVKQIFTAEGIDSSTAAVPLKESIASSGKGKFFRKDLVNVDNKDGSFVQDNSVAVSHNLLNNENGGAVKRSVPSKDDRLHWDLNTVMDAWEEPCDDPHVDPLVDSQITDTECVLDDTMRSKKLTLEGCEILRDFEDTQRDVECKVQPVACRMVSSDVDGNQMVLNSKGVVLGNCKASIKQDKLEACSGPERISMEKMCVSAPVECVLELSNYAVADTKASTPVIITDAFLDHSGYPRSHCIARTCAFDGKIDTTSTPIVVVENGEDCCRTSTVRCGKSSSESVQAGKLVTSPDMPVSNDDACEIDCIQSKDGEDSGKPSGLPQNGTSPREVVSTVTCNTLRIENSVSGSDKVGHFLHSPKCEGFSALNIAIGEGQPVVISDAKGQDDQASAADTSVNDFPMHMEPNELMPKCYGKIVSDEGACGGIIPQESCKSYGADPTSCTGKLGSEDPFSDSYCSDVSQDDRRHMVGVGNMTELQAGYDSPFEDGELREPVVYSWEENDVEDRETECVDYESDSGNADDFDAVDYSLLENFEVGRKGCQMVEKGSSLGKKDDIVKIRMVGMGDLDAGSGNNVEKCIEGDALKTPIHSASIKTKASVGDQLQLHCEGMIGEGNGGLDDEGLLAGEVGSRAASKGKLSSCIEGASTFGLIHRNDAVLIQWSRSDNLGDSYSRAESDDRPEKSMGRERFPFQVRSRNAVDDHCVDSSVDYLDTRNHYEHSYRGPEGHRYCRPRSVVANSVAKVGGLNCHDDKRSINYSAKGMYRPLIRRRSPDDGDDSYGVHRGTQPVRGVGRDRPRGRSGIYPLGVGRGPKEEYHEPVPDDAATTSDRLPHYLARRERGFSPSFSRGARFSRPHRKSWSRSRSRSPLGWNFQRDRNVRRHSPEFRSETRMERIRLPFQKPGFAADYEESFLSPPRGRLSPQRNSRWFDDRNGMDDRFGDRRSPPRMFRQSRRFDSDYSGRLKSDDYFRPMVRRGRFPQMGGTSRGRKYEDSDDDRRKHHDRDGIIHRVRRYDAGGGVRRFRYDAEDCFEARNSHNNDRFRGGTIRRDVPRIAREERGPRYNSDRMYTTASSSGLQDYGEDASPGGG